MTGLPLPSQPIVGVTVQRREPDSPRLTVGTAYVDTLMQGGAIPMLLPLTHSPDALLPLMALCHGFVITGGVADVDPSLYGESLPPDGFSDARRDALDFAVLRHAEETGKPVFGICRGCQVMNVYRGGTLAWDYPALFAGTPPVVHGRRADVFDAHTVAWEKGSWLASRMPSPPTAPVNSLHHQVCRRVAPSLRVAAVSPDGLVEAIEDARDPSRFFAVQWHPELLCQNAPDGDPSVPAARALFDRFLEACREPPIK